MPNIIRPEERPPYPWAMARVILRLLGGLALAGAVVGALGLTCCPVLAWFRRQPFELGVWNPIIFGVFSGLLAAGGAGLLLIKRWARWVMFVAGVYAVAFSGFALVYNSLARVTDWTWAGAAMAAILLSYAMYIPFKPAFGPRPHHGAVD